MHLHRLLVLAARWPGDGVHDGALRGRRPLRVGDHERQLHRERAVGREQRAAPRRDDLRRLQPGVVLTEAVGKVLTWLALGIGLGLGLGLA